MSLRELADWYGHALNNSDVARDILGLETSPERPQQQRLLGFAMGGAFVAWQRDPQTGALLWKNRAKNRVVKAGLDFILNVVLGGTAKPSGPPYWYIGLINSASYSAISADDTMSSHAGWVEAGLTSGDKYDETTRQAFTGGTSSTQSISNAASIAVFNMNATVTIKGCFLTTSSTKGGITGTLFSAGTFPSEQSCVDNVPLNVVYTATSANGS